ncbi:DUF397 domain-containing protein [Saccharopolyspora griseoalba]|uniref:DUF397 domain-containing protein n=1 Tax=Saccharopolyspora griseoalba TaxID=1431848 RepID=A0ABW2LKF2_9PSEU
MAGFTGWRTSTRTQGQGQCVEVGFTGDEVAVRDTKDRAVGIVLSRRQWRHFLERLARDEFDSVALQERGD